MEKTTSNESRRRVLVAVIAAALAPGLSLAAQPAVQVEVWKDPSCGCCKDWVAHLEANGFKVVTHDDGNSAARARLGIAPKYGSCHTAVVAGYALEGHVPASEVRRLLKERPVARGLAVPGMPVGSPGMDGSAYGGRRDSYDVLLLARDGTASVYRHYEGTVAKAPAQAGAELAEGEVRKVDKDNKKITLRHGPIKNLDMPGMTMVFGVSDPALLDKVQAGDKVRFAAIEEGGKYTVTAIQRAN